MSRGSSSGLTEAEARLREEVRELREELRLLTLRVDKQQNQLSELLEDRDSNHSFEPVESPETAAVAPGESERTSVRGWQFSTLVLAVS